jgi:aminoacylase
VPDEEISGAHGMGIMLLSAWFKSRQVAIAFDEGLATQGGAYSVFYGERLPWWVNLIAEGNTGHASSFIDGTATELILSVVNKAMAFRSGQRALLHGSHAAGCSHSVAAKSLGDVTTLNMTMIRSATRGTIPEEAAYNVIPVRMEAGFDVRISPFMPPEDMAALIDEWCRETNETVAGIPEGGGVRWEYHMGRSQQAHAATSTDPLINPWWEMFTNVLSQKFGTKCNPMVFPAATDSRFLRAEGIRAIGFSPMRHSPCLLHEHDEYLDESVFLEGCDVYTQLMRELASTPRLPIDGDQ